MRTEVIVLGSNFGGLTAAFTLKRELHGDVDVTVVSPSDRFVFNPSLIWLPFGKRDTEDISFQVEPTLTEHGIDFIHQPATQIDPDTKRVRTGDGTWHTYDYLVIATGYRNRMDAVPGLTENASTITSLEDAVHAGERWKTFLANPGPIVVGAVPGASCFGAAYEYLFNVSHQLRKAGLKKQVDLTYVTGEPFLGHFGIGGLPHGEGLLNMFFKKENITGITDAEIRHVDTDAIGLADGRELPFAYTMLIPPFAGQDVIANTPGLSDTKGYVPVRPTYQTEKYDDVYAVGIAAAVASPWHTAVPMGVPKTGYPTEVQARTATANIAAQIRGEVPTATHVFEEIPAVCVLDAGNNGVVILADQMMPPRKHSVMVPGPQAHVMKLGFEKYFLWKAKSGNMHLP